MCIILNVNRPQEEEELRFPVGSEDVLCSLFVHSEQVKTMQLFLVWFMMFMFQTGSSEDSVTPFKDVMLALEGHNVTLSCSYSGIVNNLYWYQQKPSSSPQLLIMEYSEKREGLSFRHDKTSKEFHLEISSAAVTDSAVYYCALTSRGNEKILFGEGIKLIIETNTENEPSFYKLTDGNESLCLAADFSKSKAAKEKKPFDKTAAAQINNISLYNQVVWLSDSDKCEEGGPGPEECGTLEPDPKVNMVSLTILGLRLLFLKTIVFNVLMTLRLWISQ